MVGAMIPILLAVLCWAPVTENCEGGFEVMAAYRHEVAYIRVVGTQPCGWDEAGEPMAEFGACPVYWREPFVVTAEWPDPCLPVEPLNPGPGEVALLKVTGIDQVGYEDCGQ